jgi:hypothetical protein
MTPQEAYIKAKRSNKAYENAYLIGCKDYKTSWGFAFSPVPFDTKNPNTRVGGGYITVDKTSGKISGINAVTSWKLNGKSVPLKQFEGLTRSVAKVAKNQKRAPQVAVAS